MARRDTGGHRPGIEMHEAAVARLDADSRGLLEQFELEQLVSHLLRRAHFLAEAEFAAEFAEEDMTPRQKAALVGVYRSPGLNQNALAALLHLDRNTVAELVRRLVKRKLLLRGASPADRRAHSLYLSPAGVALLGRVIRRDSDLEARLLERIPPEHRSTFMQCLRVFVARQPGDRVDDSSSCG